MEQVLSADAVRAATGNGPVGADRVVVLECAVDAAWPAVFLTEAATLRAALHPALADRLTAAGWRTHRAGYWTTRSRRALDALPRLVDPAAFWPGIGVVRNGSGSRRRSAAITAASGDGPLGAALRNVATSMQSSSGESGAVRVHIERVGAQVRLNPVLLLQSITGSRTPVTGIGTPCRITDALATLDAAQAGAVLCVIAGDGTQLRPVRGWWGHVVSVLPDTHLSRVRLEPHGDIAALTAAHIPIETLAERCADLWPAGIEVVADDDTVDLATIAAATGIDRFGLYPHQDRFCSQYAATTRGLVCAFPPGGGKTAAAVVSLAERAARHPSWRSVVVVPPGVLAQWEAAFVQWAPTLPVYREVDTWRGTTGVLLLSSGVLCREVAAVCNAHPHIDDLVVDEAGGLHRDGPVSRALWSLRHVARRGMALTGTPSGGGTAATAALIAFARGEASERYVAPARALRRSGRDAIEPAVQFGAQGDRWHRPVRLVRNDMVHDPAVVAAETQVVQAWQHFLDAEAATRDTTLLTPAGSARARDVRTARTAWLTAGRALVTAQGMVAARVLLDDVAGTPGTLVCCNHVATAAWFAQAAGDRAQLLDGSVPAGVRHTAAAQFCRGELDLLVLTRASSVGLNLQTAQRIVFLDIPLDVDQIRQRVGRAARIGHDGSKLDVVVRPVGRSGAVTAELLGRILRGDRFDTGAAESTLLAAVSRELQQR